MASVKDGDTVKVHYTGKLDDGTVFDSSVGGDPLEFTMGQGQLIEGFESTVLGMGVGESRTATMAAEQAYGPRHDDLLLTVPREELPPGLQPEVGRQLRSEQDDGQEMVMTVTGVSETEVTLDANHPLAGQALTFEIELVEIA
ncbi:MAG: peptidylprolyl isomerase [Anaerolineaceae bacterium]|nr:peptidylprolyl isomerase [Anaerolineaceae bacterium]